MKPSTLIFLGDSLTMRHNWSSFKATNMGIDGDTTSGLLSRLHQSASAKHIVVMIGVNDILNEIPLVKIQNNYTKILNAFSKEQTITVLSLLPVIDDRMTKKINQEIRTLNNWLKNEVKSRNFNYINLYPLFLDKAQKGLAKAYTTDGIHLSPKAYGVWENALRKYVN